jgi:hypothetical protein
VAAIYRAEVASKIKIVEKFISSRMNSKISKTGQSF